MPGGRSYTRDELEHARAAIGHQVAAYRELDAAVTGDTPDAVELTALEAFAPLFFNHLTLALDRYFVDRSRMVTGEDARALNELERLVDSLLNNGGVLRADGAIEFRADESILGLRIGDRIRLTAAQFERLATACFEEIEAKYVVAVA